MWLAILTRPPFLVALAVLLANDLYFKTQATSWLTGKLSDFAGLFMFAAFWTAFAPCHRRGIHIGTAMGFMLWKSPWSEPLIAVWNAVGLWELHRIVDYTDWAALVILPLSYRYTAVSVTQTQPPAMPLARTLTRAAVIVTCLAAMVATSYGPSRYHVIDWTEDGPSDTYVSGSLRLTLRPNDVQVRR